MLELTVITLLILAGTEMCLFAIVHWLRSDCQWLITLGDLTPKIDGDGLRRFVEHGWDPHLGWVRKPGTSHDEQAKDGATSRYNIDARGARRNPGFEKRPYRVLVYGDSYAFARQVNDDETWAHQLSKRLDANVVNKGVGNYGLDQALLRLEREFDSHPAPVVVMAVVPETIGRILSTWRHFSEYGNTLAFKPRFVMEGGRLKLLSNPMDALEKFLRINEFVPNLTQTDSFYVRKFRPDMLRFSYMWHLWRSRRRNLPLMAAAVSDRLGGNGKQAFCKVMERNIDLTATLYRERLTLDLLVAIIDRFAAFVRSRGATPALVLLPQLYDLRHLRAGDHYYAPLLERIADTLTVVDLGPQFAAEESDARNYIDDQFGGHLSVDGNRLAAEWLVETLSTLLADERGSEASPATGVRP